MGTAFRQRFFMMNFIYRNDDSFLKAQLTKRMCLNIAVTDSFPSSSVPATYSFISAILLVGTIRLLLMFLTVPSIRQIWTAGKLQGLFGLFGTSAPPLGITKASAEFLLQRLCRFYIFFYNIILLHLHWN